MDTAQLLVILEFLKRHNEDGPEAACPWADEQTATLEARELRDTRPDLRIVS